MLKEIERRGAKSVAIIARQLAYSVFNYAVANGISDSNPAVSLRGIVERDATKHAVALDRDEFSTLLKKINDYGNPTTKVALLILAHTFVRTVELRKAEWKEINFDTCQWRIPAEHMKKRPLHIVPLTRQSLELLRELQAITGNGRLLLPNLRDADREMTATSFNRALEYLGYAGKFTCHGFRATASTFLNEGTFTGSNGKPIFFRPDVIETQLAHVERNASRRAYNRAEHLAERGVMMNTWSDFIDSLTNDGKVINIDGRRRTAKKA